MNLSWFVPNCHYGVDLSAYSGGEPYPPGVAMDPETFVATARLVDEIGFSTLWVGDHVMIPPETAEPTHFGPAGSPLASDRPIYDPFALLSYLAAITARVRLGIGVLIVPLRNPVHTAKALATVDSLSGGRVIAGVGVGWLKDEFDTLAVPFEARGPMTDEYLDVMKALWTQEQPEYSGRFYTLDGRSPFWPKPSRGTVPFWIGGWSGPALRRTVRIGDGHLGAYGTPEEARKLRDRLRNLLEDAGRDPVDVPYGAQARFFLTDASYPSAPPCVGSPKKVADDIMQFRDAGMDELKFTPPPGPTRQTILDQLTRFAEEVQPRLDL